jgi:uncharacterized protein YqjF (DUF2071 family)
MSTKKAFLSAEWRFLFMLNYEIDPAVLAPLVPPGTELDSFNGITCVSVVGFQFLATRVFGAAFPFHRDFEEVNLRFYVRRRSGNEWRRGVVFVRELVPRAIIAWVARTVYHEPYLAVPMRHKIAQDAHGVECRYEWKRAGRWESLAARAVGEAVLADEASEEAFITEHYWGYTSHHGATTEYGVEHPKWRVCRKSLLRGRREDALRRCLRRDARAYTEVRIHCGGSPVTVRSKSIL